MNLLLEENAATGMQSWILLVIILALFVFMFIMSFVRNKKAATERQAMAENFKVGAKIMTTAGVFGTIISVRETTVGKIYLIETGDETHKSYLEIHEDGISNIDNSRNVVLDADGNDITFAEEDKVELQTETQQDADEHEKELENQLNATKKNKKSKK